MKKRIEIRDILNKDFTHYELGVAPGTEEKNDYIIKARELCFEKTSKNLKLPLNEVKNKYCKTCVFNTNMTGIYLYSDGRCNMCHTYEKAIEKDKSDKILEKELKECLSKSNESEVDVILGFSGGKDSTATLSYLAYNTDLKVEAVLVDNGYIPDFVKEYCTRMCENAGVKFTILKFDFSNEINNILKSCSTISTYPCVTCTKVFKEMLTNYAAEKNCDKVVLGRNFWSRIEPELTAKNINYAKNASAINFYYLPFLLHWTLEDTMKYLDKIGWERDFSDIDGASTNCLVPSIVENQFKAVSGNHPETALLAHETIVGFISREKALEELGLTDED